MLPKFHIKIERWKYNKTFEVYVSSMGHVRNRSKAPLVPKISSGGYMVVAVNGSNPRYMLLHRLVMLTWRPTAEAEDLTVDHLDHNKRNNALENLEWVTKEENLRRAAFDLATVSEMRSAGLNPNKPVNPKINIASVTCTDSSGKSVTFDRSMTSEQMKNAIVGLKYQPNLNAERLKFYVDNIFDQIICYPQIKKYCGLTLLGVREKEEQQ